MRIFTVACRDIETDYEMVLSECSYNQACMYLQQTYHPMDIKTETDFVHNRIYLILQGVGLGLEFCYDENRGYLMKR